MSKKLQEIVQSVSNSLSLGRLNSINDSPLAEEIAFLAKDVFEEMSTNNEWAYKKTLSNLSSSGDTSLPTHILLEDKIQNVESLRYNKIRDGGTFSTIEELDYILPEEFLDRSNDLREDRPEVQVVTDVSGVPFLIRNDRPPSYWTSFDDKWIIADSYDSVIENTLQENKIQAVVMKTQDFQIADDFIPDIPDYVYPHFLAELKSQAFIVIKQTPNSKFEQKSRQQRNYLNQRNQRAGTRQTFPNYGRPPKTRAGGLGKFKQ